MGRLGKFVSPLLAMFLAGCATLQSTSNTHGPAAKEHRPSLACDVDHLRDYDCRHVGPAGHRAQEESWQPEGTYADRRRRRSGLGGDRRYSHSSSGALRLLLPGPRPAHGFPDSWRSWSNEHGVDGSQVQAGYFDHRAPVVVGGSLSRSAGQQVITANEIHIPAHRPVNIELRTADVIHSFWVPSLHGKVDLLPGNVNFIRIEASEPGSYIGQCAEYCGKQHANMHILLIAQEPAAFEEWLANQAKPGVEPTQSRHGNGAGRHFSQVLAHNVIPCAALRRRDGSGPDLTHIGSRKEIGSDTFPTTMLTSRAGSRMPRRSSQDARCRKSPNTMERSFAPSSRICVSFSDNYLDTQHRIACSLARVRRSPGESRP